MRGEGARASLPPARDRGPPQFWSGWRGTPLRASCHGGVPRAAPCSRSLHAPEAVDVCEDRMKARPFGSKEVPGCGLPSAPMHARSRRSRQGKGPLRGAEEGHQVVLCNQAVVFVPAEAAVADAVEGVARAAFSSKGRTPPAKSAGGPSGPVNHAWSASRLRPGDFSSMPRRTSGMMSEEMKRLSSAVRPSRRKGRERVPAWYRAGSGSQLDLAPWLEGTRRDGVSADQR